MVSRNYAQELLFDPRHSETLDDRYLISCSASNAVDATILYSALERELANGVYVMRDGFSDVASDLLGRNSATTLPGGVATGFDQWDNGSTGEVPSSLAIQLDATSERLELMQKTGSTAAYLDSGIECGKNALSTRTLMYTKSVNVSSSVGVTIRRTPSGAAYDYLYFDHLDGAGDAVLHYKNYASTEQLPPKVMTFLDITVPFVFVLNDNGIDTYSGHCEDPITGLTISGSTFSFDTTGTGTANPANQGVGIYTGNQAIGVADARWLSQSAI